jgi:putative radical SAM enzyme (TIGR03279 family)
MPEHAYNGGRVIEVDPGAAHDAGVQPGDIVLNVDGETVRDVIDWWWLTDEPTFEVEVLRGDTPMTIQVSREAGQPLGVTFVSPVFDGVRECENACAFCFVSQLPPGLRPGLYVRDDDYRLSFLGGNFVTLTNLERSDVDRIVGQHLSPLHVSVHAVDPAVRARLICATSEDHALDTLDELLAAGIEAHVQVVLVPGLNDGPVLEETLRYLSARDGILSVGCVPMGYTAYQSRWNASYDAALADEVLALVARWHDRMRAERGIGWVYAADEFYLLAHERIPYAEDYDDFPQFENGIGMASAFIDEFRPPAGACAQDATVVTGELFAPILRKALRRAGWENVRVLPARNRLFGGNVSVTGLLGARDIAVAIMADGAEGIYLVPDVVLNSDGLLLDDIPSAELAELAGADVRFIGSDAGSLVQALTS